MRFLFNVFGGVPRMRFLSQIENEQLLKFMREYDMRKIVTYFTEK
jgi:hypothetical protein